MDTDGEDSPPRIKRVRETFWWSEPCAMQPLVPDSLVLRSSLVNGESWSTLVLSRPLQS